MCQRATCSTCNKATYKGCGQHVEQVLKGVPSNQRCSCPPGVRNARGRSLLLRILGR